MTLIDGGTSSTPRSADIKEGATAEADTVVEVSNTDDAGCTADPDGMQLEWSMGEGEQEDLAREGVDSTADHEFYFDEEDESMIDAADVRTVPGTRHQASPLPHTQPFAYGP